MKITSNYAMNNSSNGMSKCGKPCFGALIQPKVTEALVKAAQKSKDADAMQKLIAQLEKLGRWGSKESELVNSFNMMDMTETLTLSNPSISKYYNGDLGVNPKDGLLKQFFSLTEEKVLKAEDDIKGIVKDSRSKAAAILKEKYPNISQDKVEKAVNNMSEQEIMNLRFPVKGEVMSDNLINFVI